MSSGSISPRGLLGVTALRTRSPRRPARATLPQWCSEASGRRVGRRAACTTVEVNPSVAIPDVVVDTAKESLA